MSPPLALCSGTANFCTISHRSCCRGRGRDGGSCPTSRRDTRPWWDHSGAELSVHGGRLLTAHVSPADPASTSPSGQGRAHGLSGEETDAQTGRRMGDRNCGSGKGCCLAGPAGRSQERWTEQKKKKGTGEVQIGLDTWSCIGSKVRDDSAFHPGSLQRGRLMKTYTPLRSPYRVRTWNSGGQAKITRAGHCLP